MIPASGDAMIFAADASRIVVYSHQRIEQTVAMDPPPGISWQDFTEKVARPALLAAGWALNTWHRPRNNTDLIATAFVWHR